MRNLTMWQRSLVLVLSLALLGSVAAFAQTESGNLYGRVTDDQGERLPGVTVTLSGPGSTQVQVTDAAGEFRFLSLAPGNYSIEASLEGFGTVIYEAVNIRIGRNTTVELQLNPAIEETITVTTESPLLDERKISQGIEVTAARAAEDPDRPRSVGRRRPDSRRVDGPHQRRRQRVRSAAELHRLPVPRTARKTNSTSMVSTSPTSRPPVGASSTYFGFEQFEEMSFQTGGTDVTIQTPGVQLNMVTKRGTNEWRGSGSYNETDESWQSSGNLDRGRSRSRARTRPARR